MTTFEGQGPSDVVVKGLDDLLYVIGAGGPTPTDGNDLGRVVNGSAAAAPSTSVASRRRRTPTPGRPTARWATIPADCLAQVPPALLPLIQPYSGIVDSNVYSVDYNKRFGVTLVTDAAGNSVHLMGRNGPVKTWILPPVSPDRDAGGDRPHQRGEPSGPAGAELPRGSRVER